MEKKATLIPPLLSDKKFLPSFVEKEVNIFHDFLSRQCQRISDSAQCCIPYRNQRFDLQYKLNDMFLYEMQHWWNGISTVDIWPGKFLKSIWILD